MNDQMKMLDAYFTLMNINGADHVYRQAVQSGLLDCIHKNPGTPEVIAEACGVAVRPARLILEVLATLGIVHSNDDTYALTPLTASLINGNYRYLGDPYWNHLPTFLNTDKPLMKMDAAAESESHYQTQAAALAWMLAPAAEAAAQILSNGTATQNPAIVDVGAGSAIWSLTMARHMPQATVTAVDWPAVLSVAQKTAAQFNLSDRLSTIAGNYHEVDIPGSTFDLAILGNVTHLETTEGNRSLFAKLHEALKPGGHIVIFDIFPGEKSGDLNRTLYTLGLALRTESGKVYSPQALESLLDDTGFVSAKLTSLPVPPYAIGMLTARRPE